MINIIKVLIVFSSLFLIISGCQKECENDIIVEELNPCDIAIDKTIKFDTLWLKEFSENIYKIDFSEKYFWISFDYSIYYFYSIETGEIITSIDQSILPNYYPGYIRVKDDYLYCYSNQDAIVTNYRYNLLSNELKIINIPNNHIGFKFESDHFYFKSNEGIVKTDYDLTYFDTIYQFEEPSKVYGVSMEIYSFPESINKKYLALAYNIDKDSRPWRSLAFKLIDLETNKLIENLGFTTGTNLRGLSIIDNMINISSSSLKIVYDLKTNHYFANHSNSYFDSDLFSISNRETHNGDKSSMVFFYNKSFFNAYDLYTGNPVWSCEDKNIVSLFPFNLYDDKGNIYPYMTFVGKRQSGLIDPYTGIIKAEFTNSIKNISEIHNENELFYWDNNNLFKLKITKK